MTLSRITILAPGLIGGSVALAATRAFPKAKIILWTRRSESIPALRSALPKAEIGTEPSLIAGSDLVILAAPPSALVPLAQNILPHLAPTTLVTDVSSIKGSVEKSLAPIFQKKARWIGSHPMAGSEISGFAAARHDLFQNAPVILTPTPTTSSDTLQDATSFWKSLGAHVLTMSPTEHDTKSHKSVTSPTALRQLSSSLLVRALFPWPALGIEIPPGSLQAQPSSGQKSLSKIARISLRRSKNFKAPSPASSMPSNRKMLPHSKIFFRKRPKFAAPYPTHETDRNSPPT